MQLPSALATQPHRRRREFITLKYELLQTKVPMRANAVAISKQSLDRRCRCVIRFAVQTHFH